MSNTFFNSLKELTGEQNAIAARTLLQLSASPKSNALQFHRLSGCKDPNFWSVRVNDDIRIIIHQSEGNRVLCYVDHHDAAYDWARRRRISKNPITGSIQIEWVDLDLSDPPPIPHSSEPKGAVPSRELFTRLGEDELLGVGVPRNLMESVQNVQTSNQFVELIDFLPEEVAEALTQYLETGLLPAPTKPSSSEKANPYRHRDTRRRFRIVKDEKELALALSGEWADWRVFLHPTQQEAVEREFSGPARVSGAAGTGKTVVALHRALRMAREEEHNQVLLTTYSKTLAARMRDSMTNLASVEAPELQRVKILNLHQLAADIYAQHHGQRFKMSIQQDRDVLFREVLTALGTDEAGANACIAEWDNIVNEEGVTTWEQYRSISRAGRGTAMNVRQREHLWQVLEALTAKLAESGRMTPQQLCQEARRIVLETGTPYTHVIADEVQDFGPSELRLLVALAGPTEQLFLTGDIGQRIYKGKTSFRSAGIELRGRTMQLTVNYRTTEQIRKFADAFMPGRLQDADDEETRGSISLLKGAHPDVIKCNVVEQEISKVTEWLQALLSRGHKASDIGIFVRTRKLIDERALQVAARLKLNPYLISDEGPPKDRHISVGTMHNSKGLEFKIVVLMGVEDTFLPNKGALRRKNDDAERAAFTEQERNLFYVACTRARERLLITSAGKPSSFLGGK